MKIREYIEKIGENKKPEDMQKLGDMLAEIICEMKDIHEDLYKKYKKELYEMAYGKVLTKEKAEEIIINMKPYHLHWSLEQTKSVQQQLNMNNIRDIDFWIVMNMAYNDYHDLFEEDVEKYAEYSKMFIQDEDAKESKVYCYFMTIPKNS